MSRSTNSNWLIIGALTFLFLVLSVLAHFEPRFPCDLQTTRLFQSIHSASLLAFMRGVSYVFEGWRTPLIVIAGGVIAWLRLGRLEGGMVILSGIITIINAVFKVAVDRPRPSADLVTVFAPEADKSFPSGHAFFAMLVLGMFAYLAATNQTRPAFKVLTISVTLFLDLWIGASRIYLGAHWLSDVIGGYVIGSLFLFGQIWLYRKLRTYPANRRPAEKSQTAS